MKPIKKQILFLAFITVVLFAFCVPVKASEVKTNHTAVTSGTDKNIKVKSVKYDLEEPDDDDDETENIEIKFSTKVKWSKKASITVKDEKGISLDAEILDKDNDDCDIFVEKLKEGHTYVVALEGLKAHNGTKYGTVTITFQIPIFDMSNTGKGINVTLEDVDYDEEDEELEFSFSKKVVFSKNAKVTIKNKNGKSIKTRLSEKDSDECTIEVNLKDGETYYFVIEGIKLKSDTSFGQFSGSFIAEE